MNRYILIMIITVVLCSCGSTRIVTLDVPRIEKEYITSTDTVHQFDSVYVFNDKRVVKDTVYISKVNEKFRYIYKTRTDTLLRTDTVTIVNTEQIKALVKENDKLKAVGYFYRRLGLCLIGIIAVMGVYTLFKR